MHKDTVIAHADDECITEIVISALCPVCYAVGMQLTSWLANRTVDTNRSHIRRLFMALRMRTNADIAELIEAGHGISITDNWWI